MLTCLCTAAVVMCWPRNHFLFGVECVIFIIIYLFVCLFVCFFV